MNFLEHTNKLIDKADQFTQPVNQTSTTTDVQFHKPTDIILPKEYLFEKPLESFTEEEFERYLRGDSNDQTTGILKNVNEQITNLTRFLYSGRKDLFKTQEDIDAYTNLNSAVRGYDFFPTPSKYSVQIFNDVYNWYGKDVKKIKVLDIACGLLSLSMPYIINGIKIEGIEFTSALYQIIKPLNQLSHVNIIRDNFIELSETHYFKKDIDVIVMNPPFSGYLHENKNYLTGKETKLYYFYFIMKAVDILINSRINRHDNSARFLYVICPKTYFEKKGKISVGDFVELDMPKSIVLDASKRLNIDYWDDYSPHITFMGDVEEFRTVKNGKPVKMSIKCGLFKFEIH
jgi:hypothetical protein